MATLRCCNVKLLRPGGGVENVAIARPPPLSAFKVPGSAPRKWLIHAHVNNYKLHATCRFLDQILAE